MGSTQRRTKIVSTLGPSTDEQGVLEAILEAGVNVVRMNFSHGTADDHRQRATKVRNIAAKLGTHVAILGDLQGPKSVFLHLKTARLSSRLVMSSR